MTRRAKVWLVVAVLFLVGNLAGAAVAVAAGEMPHAGVHVGLALLGAYLAWRVSRGRAAPRTDAASATAPSEFAARLRGLEQSVDAVAVEVERIGEGQRFVTRLFAERSAQGAGDGGARPVESQR
jgi:hypothetical protein